MVLSKQGAPIHLLRQPFAGGANIQKFFYHALSGERYGLAGAFVRNVTLSLKTRLEKPLKP
jgi:hypothetical protein